MTTGKRIKYFRKQLGMSQSQFAQASGINLVTLKRYENDKSFPPSSQIDRLAKLFNVGRYALTGENLIGPHLETVGDLVGLIISLCNSNILKLTGERDSSNRIIEDTLQLELNPSLDKYCKLFSKNLTSNIPNTNLIISMYGPLVVPQLLDWEKATYLYQCALTAAGSTPNKSELKALHEIEELVIKVELEAQKSSVLINLEPW